VLDAASGEVAGDFPAVQMTGVLGTPDGFAYTVEAGNGAGTLLYTVATADGAVGEPGEVWAGAAGQPRRLVWAG